ncbi:hypothetical protein [Phaffia rhodozyma]|uniref:Thioredoxin-like fold n=1 Tax=Phaffia rhodozyma TaxID=264483 RepID=A0A0F7SUH6_PHARH|nr:hypothetical protein [Phaffia rhodozyma]
MSKDSSHALLSPPMTPPAIPNQNQPPLTVDTVVGPHDQPGGGHPLTRHTHKAPNTPDVSHLDFTDSFFSGNPRAFPQSPQRTNRQSDDEGSDDALVLMPSRKHSFKATSPAGQTKSQATYFTPASPNKDFGPFSFAEKKRTERLGSELPLSMAGHFSRNHRTPFSTFISRKYRRILLVAAVIFAFIFVFRAHQASNSSRTILPLRIPFSERTRLAPISAAALRKRPGSEANRSKQSQQQSTNEKYIWKKNEELAGLIEYLASAPTEHALPPSVDRTVDAELVLDFDPLLTADPDRAMREMVETVWRERVVVLLGKGYGNPRTKAIQATLQDMNVIPAPVVIEVDRRADSDQLVPVLSRLVDTSIDEFPVLLVGGKMMHRADFEESRLRTLISNAGGSFRAVKKKKGKK